MTDRKIKLEEIYQFVPHRPPMVWVDEIVSFSDHSGACAIHIKSDGHYMGTDGLRPSSCLEFIAQAYGYCSVAYKYSQNPNTSPLKRAFLAAFKDVELPDAATLKRITGGTSVIARFSGVRQIGPITMLDGEVVHDGAVICRANLKVFCEN